MCTQSSGQLDASQARVDWKPIHQSRNAVSGLILHDADRCLPCVGRWIVHILSCSVWSRRTTFDEEHPIAAGVVEHGNELRTCTERDRL